MGEDNRIENGRRLFEDGKIHGGILPDKIFLIEGKSYVITLDSCSCPDHMLRKVICKHMWAARFLHEKIQDGIPRPDFSKLATFVRTHGNVVPCVLVWEVFPDELLESAIEAGILTIAGRDFVLVKEPLEVKYDNVSPS